MLFPKKVKHRKWQRSRKNPDKVGVASRGSKVDFGSFGLKALSYGRIRSNQIEASRKILKRSSGKFSTVWIRIFPDRPFTQKAAEVGMGKGKGDLKGYEVEVFPGRVLFEVDGVDEKTAREALRKAGTKMPVKTKIVSRN
ncbi:50S ribosomal protein L16 [Candidatus Campbellbacteria bacterium CG22_combo_CG10-13_8_21_14_all_36_13]|uniref:50S ribosomal protein L16 n=1 Tax=Candidatus Campbellbacteria bacterium CG22_combo_CG10-13_8_21_14_all_36_13 TaxID=1974529 RepID=A0A2H0DY88_9BACT|nr:MAG: 50S ribosomal protein L16 [Candidatus Campbellbacteria bacterium CG22_combo_CG10-13_8_21_14_all_36_13]